MQISPARILTCAFALTGVLLDHAQALGADGEDTKLDLDGAECGQAAASGGSVVRTIVVSRWSAASSTGRPGR